MNISSNPSLWLVKSRYRNTYAILEDVLRITEDSYPNERKKKNGLNNGMDKTSKEKIYGTIRLDRKGNAKIVPFGKSGSKKFLQWQHGKGKRITYA